MKGNNDANDVNNANGVNEIDQEFNKGFRVYENTRNMYLKNKNKLEDEKHPNTQNNFKGENNDKRETNENNENIHLQDENIFKKYAKRFLLIPKTLYFSYTFIFYALHAYRSQFIVSMYGAKKSAIGMYMAIPQCISFIFGVFIASFNDKLGIQKYILLAALSSATIIYTTFFFINNFALFMVNYVLYFCFVSITIPMIDKVVLEYLQGTPGCSTSDYGRQRLFVPLGFITIGFILDAIVGQSKNSSGVVSYDFSKMLYYGITAGIIAIATTLLFVKNLPRRENVSSNMSLIFSVIKNKEFMFFTFIILLNGITRASMTNYLNVYFDDHCGFSKDYSKEKDLNWLEKLHNNKKKAWAGMFGNGIELLIYFVSPYIISKLGLLQPMFISQIFQLIRFLGYYVLSNKSKHVFEWAMMLELCKGVNFGLMQSTAAALAMKFCAPNMKSIAQLVYSGTFVALGSVIAGVAFKYVFDSEKAVNNVVPVKAYKKMFLIDMLLTVATMGLMILKYVVLENVMLNKQNLKEKLEEIEKEGEVQEKIEKNINSPKQELADQKVVKA
ncbi:hypothetical protein EHP00_1522 [Ecytonucleospora hepatopenaei]|uniref:Major facilitator superfamily associated domain-containing protein n=1 Tax=Ecytonucleospora hepatopenaei TaxID=646526 RepID=A0A1W0E3V1_9MICR|nr:hypothetical protein EHP00_1522 [Ecytonucleospora hepatopenaei]